MSKRMRRWATPVVLVDPDADDCPIVAANDAFLSMTRYAAHDVIGRNCRFLQAPATDELAIRRLGEAVRSRSFVDVCLVNRRRDGSLFHNYVTIAFVDIGRGKTIAAGVQVPFTPRHIGRFEASPSLAHAVDLARHPRDSIDTTTQVVESIVMQARTTIMMINTIAQQSRTRLDHRPLYPLAMKASAQASRTEGSRRQRQA
ncbi:MAG: PAS domain-containing protein [Pseudomonadota bacterium]